MKREAVSEGPKPNNELPRSGRETEPTLKALLFAETPRVELVLPKRGLRLRRRPSNFLEVSDKS